jgi:hypothetical protein
MRKSSRRRLRAAFLWLLGLAIGAVLGGFLALFFFHFLKHYLHARLVTPVAIGLAVAMTFGVLRLIRLQSRLFRPVSPLVAGLIAALGVHMARVWL